MALEDQRLDALWKGSLAVLGLLATKLVFDKALGIWRTLKVVSYLPCRQISFFHPFRAVALLVGFIYPRPGRIGSFHAGFSLYKKYGSTVLSSILFWNATPIFWLADSGTLKVVTTERSLFQKEVDAYGPVNIWGVNVATSEGTTWRRHRVVANPAFNEANIVLVWSETNRLLAEWFADIEAKKDGLGDEYRTLDLNRELIQFTLFILTSAAFGHQSSLTSFKSPPPSDSHHTLPFHTSLSIVVDGILLRYITPTALVKIASYISIPYISKRVCETEKGFEELRLYILEMITAARDSINTGKSASIAKDALLRNLVEANMKQDGEYKCLTDQELLADVFMFLLAGHETSSHALAFAITLIAFYPDVQRKLYEEVKSVWPNECPALGATSVFNNDFNKLVYTQATFRETLRHHPVIPRVPKIVVEDTTLTGLRFEPNSTPSSMDNVERFEVHVPKGSLVLLDFQGVHMNPIHWGEDAQEFKPERFIDTETYRWPRDAFLPFSAGVRACIGTRFALAESVAILANLVHAYEILLPTDVEKKLKEMEDRGMGVVERMEWLSAWSPGVTNTPHRAKVRVRRRV